MASDEDSAKDELGDSCKTYIKNVSDARRLRCDGMCAKWDKMVIVTDDQLSLADGRAGLGHSAPKRMPRSATRALRALDNWIPQDEVMSSVATIRTLCGRCLPLSYCFRPRCGATDEKMLPLSPPIDVSPHMHANAQLHSTKLASVACLISCLVASGGHWMTWLQSGGFSHPTAPE